MCKRTGKPGCSQRHPLNADGPFYVEDGICVGCCLMHGVAPDLMGMHEYPQGDARLFHCYVKKQPLTRPEIDQAIEAAYVSEVAALRYAGNDLEIIQQMVDRGLEAQCDALVNERKQ